MTVSKFVRLVLVAGALALPSPPRAKADEWDKATVVTFSAPVEIPGRVLAPGAYVFKLADGVVDRHVVQIYTGGRRRLIATVLAVPDYRLKPSDHGVIRLEERAAGSPEAVKEWFYAGDLYGEEFVYHARETHAGHASRRG